MESYNKKLKFLSIGIHYLDYNSSDFYSFLIIMESAAQTQQYIPVYGDTEATSDNCKGGIYGHVAQNPDQLNAALIEMCKKFKVPNNNMQEIIEVGFFFQGKTLDVFRMPRVNPKLYPFITELTGITQEMLEGSPTFKDGFPSLNSELGKLGVDTSDPKYLAVFCGKWDFEFPLTAHVLNDELKLPVFFQRVCDIKVIFEKALKDHPDVAAKHTEYVKKNTKLFQKARTTMQSMLYALDMTFDGTQHRAHDDATNVARVGEWLLKNGYTFEPTFIMPKL